MPNPKRSKREEEIVDPPASNEDEDLDSSEDDDSDDKSSSLGDGDEMMNTVLNVDFDAFPPGGPDFHGIKKLLLQIFRNAHINVTDLAEHLIELNKLSIVLRQSEDEIMDEEHDGTDNDGDVFALAGLLPLEGDREGVKGVRNFLLEMAGEKGDVRSKLEELLATGRVGFMLSERFVNIPPRVTIPVLKSIQEDWKKMPKSNKALDFTHFILICKRYQGTTKTLYANAEEELFAEIADFEFSYEVPRGDADTAIAGRWREDDEEFKQVRQVLILESKKLPQMIQLVEDNI